MRPACVQAVQAAIGRALTAAQARQIDEGLNLQMRLLAQRDPAAWGKLTQTERLQQAAQTAAAKMVADIKKAQQRLLKDINANDRIANFMAGIGIGKPGSKLLALSRVLDFDTKGGGFTSAASWSKAIQQETFARLIDVWSASHPKFFQLFENRQGVVDLIHELKGEKTGNAAAAAGAKAWRTVMDDLKQRYNAAGGDVGELEDWGFPQSHSDSRIASAGLAKWLSDTLPLMDRSKFLNPDGSRMNDAQVGKILTGAFDSITTDGVNKLDTTRPQGYGQAADRGSQHRVLHFKDADSWLKYQGMYGEKSLWNVLTGHVREMARNVGMAEVLGPGAERTFGAWNQRTQLEELRALTERGLSESEVRKAQSKITKQASFNDQLFDFVSGHQKVVNPELAAKFQGFRNFTTAVKLPKVIITALGDEAGMMSTAFANKVPYSDAFMREMGTLNPADRTNRSIMEHNGVGLDSMMGGLNRFGQDEYNGSWTSKMANSVMHASGAERMWDARRQGLGSVLMSYLAGKVKELAHFSDVNRQDHGVLANKGVTENDWQVWKLAEPEMWKGVTGDKAMLTPRSIAAIPDRALEELIQREGLSTTPQDLRRHASTQLLAHVLEEAGMGAMDTGPRQRVSMQFGLTKGTLGGELVRSALLFKGFAASMMMKHWARAAEMPGAGSKFAYLAPIALYGTAIAALGNQLRNVLAGRDPENMASPSFWGAAILRGGGLGFFGDFMYDEFTEHDTSLIAALGGPLATTAEDVWKLTGGAMFAKLRGQKTDEAAKLIRLGKENTPFLNLWYLQAAMNHILWNQIQEAASPGYLDRMQAKAERMKGTTWYWEPGEHTPSRAPDVSLEHLWNPERGADELQRVAENVGID